MLSSERKEESGVAGESPSLVLAGEYASTADGFDHGLAVLALGRPYWLIPENGMYRLMVEPQDFDAVRQELIQFDRESAGWPPPPIVEARVSRRGPWLASLLWALVVIGIFGAEVRWPGRLQAAGDMDARALFHGGEWWRLGTALFLHADPGHLISNVVSGFFVLAAVLSVVGLARGAVLLAAASVLGNFAVAAAYYPNPYESLGASTAIFAGLGLLTGRAVRSVRRAPRPHRWSSVYFPLGSGLTLLGLYGAGEAQTDVAAHLAGFIAGFVLGFAAGLAAIRTPKPESVPPVP